MATPLNEQQDRHEVPPPPGDARGWRHVPMSRIPKGEPDGGKVGGVVAGISRAYGFDLRTTRIATAVAMIVIPVLILVYLAAWVLLPPTPAEAAPLEVVLRDRRRLPLIVAIGLVLLVGSLGSLGSWFLFRGAPWGLVLIGLGVLLWVFGSGRNNPRSDPPKSDPAGVTDGTSFPPPALPVRQISERAHRRPRRPIASIGLGVAVLWCAIAAMLEAFDWWSPPRLWVLVTAIAIVTAGLLASTIVNRSWVLPAPFIVAAFALIGLCIAQPRLDGGSGTRTTHPTTAAAAEQVQRMAAGELTLDLRDVPIGSREVVVHAELGFGRLHVLVPTDAGLRVTTDVGAGEVTVLHQQIASGIRQHDTRTFEGAAIGSTVTMVLDLRVGMGQIDVERAPSADRP